MESIFPPLVAFFLAVVYLYRWASTPSTPIHPKASPKPPSQPEPEQTVTKEPGLPIDWLTSPALFELEKRAIFSKKWLPLALTPLFTKPGTYITSTPAGIPLFLIRSKDGQIRAFHNVCRHRAYPVTRPGRESGCSTVLSCRYHGWSYDSSGKLIKAPKFDGVEGFEKSANGLFGVGVKVRDGLVWVNLSIEGEGVDGKEEDMAKELGIDLGGSAWVGGGRLEGSFNWKMALQTTLLTDALGLGGIGTLPSCQSSIIQSMLGSFHWQREPKPRLSHLFPNMFLFPIPNSQCWVSLNILPLSERTTSVRYDLYSSSPENTNEKESGSLLSNLEERVKTLISELETKCQLGNSIFTSTLSDLQDLESSNTWSHILTLVKEHVKLEKSQGEAIYPAKREPRLNKRYEQAEQRSL
ncbi:putative iron-sulfur cluster-binding protein [Aspergillus mulundensis]|uniref:Rieske domain-containing protein n=1 Tax=Aspergillus mulundensis TaxID=1810919 RepID=A0A3D8SCN6_9EURO|nr:hypothetical protein DSM5745_04180 [Aspergillus mulundensis]RDW83854.1 hypothetical protein DSM5745_04180 [Aspergillus mulundensis]